MEIHGRLIIDQGRRDIPVALITIDRKQVAVAVIVASFPDGATDNADLANTSLALLARTADAHGLFGTLHKIELGTEPGAASRIEMALAVTEDGDTIVFMFGDAAIFDITWRTLNVRIEP